MTRTHRIIFLCIGVLALATLLFGLLQFAAMREESEVAEPETEASDGGL